MMIALALAFIGSLIVADMIRRAGIIDIPNERSNHTNPTPRGGGLGIVVGFCAGLFWLADFPPAVSAALAGITLMAGLAALMGLIDDCLTLGAKSRFIALIALSLAVSIITGPVTDMGYQIPWILGLLGSALWVFTTANAVNFMDGSDGLMVAALIPASLALGFMGEGPVMVSSFVFAASLAGFAVWNAPLLGKRGRVFAGDVGSLGAAFLFAGLALYWVSLSPSGSVWLAPVLIMPLLADVLLTMAARFRAKRKLFIAHRAHAYQLMIRMGSSHAQVACVWAALSLGFGVLALIGHAGPMWAKPAVFLIAIAIAMILHRIVRNKARAAGLDVTE